MLDRLNSIIGAFQLDDSSFELWSLSSEKFAVECATPAAGARQRQKLAWFEESRSKKAEGSLQELGWMKAELDGVQWSNGWNVWW